MSTADHAGRQARPSTPRGAAGDSPTSPMRRVGAPAGADAKATRPVSARPAESPLPASPVTSSPKRDGARPGQTSGAPAAAAPRPASSRRVKLTVSRIDPWSAMKMSFLLSVALGIAGVVMVAVLWTVLEGMGVFDQVNGVIGQVVQDGTTKFDILDFIGFTRVVSLSIVIGVIDVILITAISTLGAFLYNVSSALVGGVQLTLTDD